MVHKTKYNPFEKYENDMTKYGNMSLAEAKDLLGNRANWELRNMKKALETATIMNTSEENQRLVAVRKVLKSKR